MNGRWLDGLRFYFKVLLNSISAKSGRLAVLMKSGAQWNPVYDRKDLRLRRGSIPGPLVKEKRKVGQKVVPLHNGFMILLCNYQCDMGYFL